jgi:DNA-binding MarR family transcriptional regulator
MSIRQKILTAIERDPRTVTEIADETGIERKRVTDNMTAIVKEQLATRANDDGAVMYTITDKGKARIGNAGARDTVRKFVSTPSRKPEEQKQAIVHTAASAQTVQDLANALDRINELKLRLDQPPPIETCATVLQQMLEFGISLTIFEAELRLMNSDGSCYACKPDDLVETISAMAMLEERLVA